MILVRDSGEHEHYRYTVMLKNGDMNYFYAFPEDTTSNYRYLGSSESGQHDGSWRGEIIDISNLPNKWIGVIEDLDERLEETKRMNGNDN